MKLLIVGHTYTVAANHRKIAELARHLDLEIVLVTPQGWRGPLYTNVTEAFHDSPLHNVRHEVVHAFGLGKEGSYVYSPRLFTIIKQFKPDIAYVEQGAYALSYLQVLFGLKFFSPHTKSCFFTWWNLPYALSGVKRISQTFNFRHSAGAIAGNAEAKSVLQSQEFASPVWIIPQLGVDVTRSGPRYRLSQENLTIGYIGRVTEEKGVLDLVRAVDNAKNKKRISLKVVGIGPALEQMKSISEKSGIHAQYYGAVYNAQVPKFLNDIDVLVLPSRSTRDWVEQFGHILIEAMAAGVPVIGSNSGEIPNVIGDAGFIYPEGDVASLSNILDRLHDDPALATRLSTLGLERIRSHFTHSHLAKELMKVFKWLERNGVPVGKVRHADYPREIIL